MDLMSAEISGLCGHIQAIGIYTCDESEAEMHFLAKELETRLTSGLT